jgi:hypothetical protein
MAWRIQSYEEREREEGLEKKSKIYINTKFRLE